MRSRIVQGFGAGSLGLYLTLAAAGACLAQECVGDCNGDGIVAINELITGVNTGLGLEPVSACPALSCNTGPLVYIDCLIVAVNNALSGCAQATPTPSAPYPLSDLQELCGEETGAALLAIVRPEYVGTLTPRPDTPWTAPFSFTLRLTYRGGAITCHPAFVPPPGSSDAFRDAQVSIIMEVEFNTENGAFAETVDTELMGWSPSGYADLSFSRRPEDIQGTYRPDLPGFEDVFVGVGATFHGDSAGGVVFQTGTPPGKVSEFIPIAYF